MDVQEYEEKRCECRAKLARGLRWEDVPDAVWGHLDSLGLVYDAVFSGIEKPVKELQKHDEAWQELESEARDYRRELESYTRDKRGLAKERMPLSPSRREQRDALQEIEIELDDDTEKRGEVYSETAATLAEQRPDVRRFRSRYLGGRLLTEGEADAFVRAGRNTGRKRLDRLALTLNHFYGWKVPAAVRFLLTGKEPDYRPVRVAVGFGESIREYVPNTARVVVEADAWADVEEVANAYRAARRQILGGDRKKRKMNERSLEVVRFVTGHIRKQGFLLPWPELQRQWNQDYPQWRYNDRNGLARAYQRSYKRLMHPKYNYPEWKRR